MDSFWQGFFTVIAVVVITLFVITLCLRIEEETIPSVKRVDTSTLKSGDILVTGRGTVPDALKLGRWGHAAIVDRENNGDIYVVEMNRYSKEMQGFLRIPWEEWVKYHPREECAYLSINKPVKLDWKKFKYCQLDKVGIHWLKYMCLNKNPAVTDKYTCSGLVIRLLQDSGVIDKKWNGCSYTPSDLAHKRMTISNGYRYADAVRFTLP